jgi:DNA-binding response OmpR family regulator
MNGGSIAVVAMQKNILLVDDDPSVRQMLRRVLAEEGYHVVLAADGAEALGSACANTMDLALLDLSLPGKDGWKTFEQLSIADPLMPIVIITARPNQSYRAQAAGAGALMEKPFDFPKLLGTIHELLNEPAAARAARAANRKAAVNRLQAAADGPLSGSPLLS